MSILICVIIALVAINVVLAYYVINMHFFMKNRVNSIIRNSETLINISKDLKECAGKVSSEQKSINDSNSIENKSYILLFDYIRNINVCVVFFTLMMSAGLVFLIELKGLKNIQPNDIVLNVFYLVGLVPAGVLIAKLICYMIETMIQKKWVAVFAFIITCIVFAILLVFQHFSLVKLVPDVMKILTDNEVTKEYLVGDWRCNGIRYKSIMEDGKFSEYMRNGNVDFNLSFKLDNNELYKLNDDSKEWNLSDFIDKYTGKVLFEELEGAKSKFKGTAERVSDNEFKVDEEYIMTRNDTRSNYLDDKVKTTSICIRIN